MPICVSLFFLHEMYPVEQSRYFIISATFPPSIYKYERKMSSMCCNKLHKQDLWRLSFSFNIFFFTYFYCILNRKVFFCCSDEQSFFSHTNKINETEITRLFGGGCKTTRRENYGASIAKKGLDN
jgi:hypothetical protein